MKMGSYFSKAGPAPSFEGEGVQFVVTPGLEPCKDRAGTRSAEDAVAQAMGWDRRSQRRQLDGIWKREAPLTDIGGAPNEWMKAALHAWSFHHPLEMRADHIWLLILQALTTHIENNAEELRYKYVRHAGKKELVVRCDHFVKGSRSNDWAGCIGEFSRQIDANVTEAAGEILRKSYSTTTPTVDIATKVTVMDGLKKYFDYCCVTGCGFPYVRLRGTEQDWVALRENAERLLTELCTKDFAAWWGPSLYDVLDRFVASYRKALAGEGLRYAEQTFWNSMIKRGSRGGSGGFTWFSGWHNIFFPLLNGKRNRWCEPYSSSRDYVNEGKKGLLDRIPLPRNRYYRPKQTGPEWSSYPEGLSSAPVKWQYFNKTFPMQFKSGFVGVEQDPVDGCLRPVVGWWILDSSHTLDAEGNSLEAEFKRRVMVERNRWSRGDVIEIQRWACYSRWEDARITDIKGPTVFVETKNGDTVELDLYGEQVQAKVPAPQLSGPADGDEVLEEQKEEPAPEAPAGPAPANADADGAEEPEEPERGAAAPRPPCDSGAIAKVTLEAHLDSQPFTEILSKLATGRP